LITLLRPDALDMMPRRLVNNKR